MKKIKKSFISLCLFLMYSKNIYATTTGTYVVEESGIQFAKVLYFVLGVCFILGILYYGYMTDKKDNAKKKRDDFIKKQSKNESDDNDSEDKIDYLKDVINLKDSIENKDDMDATSRVDIVNDELDRLEIKDDYKAQETQVIDINNYQETEDNDDDDEDDDDDITFDDLLKQAEAADDLEDIENELKKANIKRYTRNKNSIGDRNKSKLKKKPVVFYKEKDENDIISEAKRLLDEQKEAYENGKIAEEYEDTDYDETDANFELEDDIDNLEQDDEKIEEDKIAEENVEHENVKRKRGRPLGSKNKPKVPAKRGRPLGSKNKPKNGTNKKRGRPSKKELEKRKKAEEAKNQ